MGTTYKIITGLAALSCGATFLHGAESNSLAVKMLDEIVFKFVAGETLKEREVTCAFNSMLCVLDPNTPKYTIDETTKLTPFHIAVMLPECDRACFQAILDNGGRPEVADGLGNTALHHIVPCHDIKSKDTVDMIYKFVMLLETDEPLIMQKNNSGKTVIDLLCERERESAEGSKAKSLCATFIGQLNDRLYQPLSLKRLCMRRVAELLPLEILEELQVEKIRQEVVAQVEQDVLAQV